MAFTLNRRLSSLVNSSGQLNTGKIANDYITGDHIADNVVTTAMLHTGFTLPISSLTSIDTDDVTEGSTNLFYTTARVDSHLSGGTGVTYSSGAISIGQAVATTDSPTFADLTITGNLNITGDINSYNVTDLDVTDQTITLGAGQIEANSGGSGIIIDGSNASILWDETNDQFDFNKGINVDSNTLVVDGTNNRVGILQASPAVSLDVGSATDAFFVPKGTTAQRPTGVDGYFRYNTDDAQFEGYADGEWGAIAGSGGASAMETNNFTGDGSTTAFTLSSSVASEDNLIVFIEGIYQNKGDYVASGTTLTFTTAPVNGRRIVVQHILSSVAGNSTLYTSLTGDGSTTAFTLSGAPGHENNTQVFMDGVYQQKDSYIVNGTTLTFDAAPANTAEIEVMSFAQTTINQPGTNTVSVAELNLSDGTAGQFITTDGNGTISFSTVSGTTINNNADNRIITGSGTADTLNGESGLTYDGSTLAVTGSMTAGSGSLSGILNIQAATSGAKLTVGNFGDTARAATFQGGSILIDGGAATEIIIGDGNVAYMSIQTTDDATAMKIRNFSGSADLVTIERASGKVGIGTASPTSKLHAYHSTNASDTLVFVDNLQTSQSGTDYNKYGIVGQTRGADASWSRGVGVSGLGDAATFHKAIGVYAGLNTTLPTGFATDSALYADGNSLGNSALFMNGNVGIGTTSPSAKLHVIGTIEATTTTTPQIIAKYDATNWSALRYDGVDTGAGGDGVYRRLGSEKLRLTASGVTITGALSKGSGSFKIDHPLEAKKDTHHLIHSFVEAPQADNIYRGKVDLVAGSATANIDTVAGMTEGTFVALNREVQCFTTNESNWDAVKGSVSGNILTIESENSESTATISWLVIGERKDQHMYDTDWTDDDGKVIVEPLKTEETPQVNLENA